MIEMVNMGKASGDRDNNKTTNMPDICDLLQLSSVPGRGNCGSLSSFMDRSPAAIRYPHLRDKWASNLEQPHEKCR